MAGWADGKPLMAIDVRNLSAGYFGVPVLSEVNFHVDNGETVSFIGRNGSGKSTLMKALSGVVPVAKGEFSVDGVRTEVSPGMDVAARLVYIPQDGRVVRRLTVRENLRLAAYSLDRLAFRSALDMALAVAPYQGLASLLDRRAESLSGGEVLLAALCCAKLRPGKLTHFVLDEPTAGLDRDHLAEVAQILRWMNAPGNVIILAEQDLWMAFTLADRVYVMRPTGEGTFTPVELDSEVMAEIGVEMAAVRGPNPSTLRFIAERVW